MGTPEAMSFDALMLRIQEYEARHYQIERRSRKVENLYEQTLRAIAASEVPAEFAHLDHLIKDWKP